MSPSDALWNILSNVTSWLYVVFRRRRGWW
jgi:hypothetical protein